MSPNESQLVRRAVQRDHDAFTQLYDAYATKIYRYIYCRVGSRAETEDLCGQVFLRAWEAIERYTWRGYPFSSWLYRVAHNLVVDHYRGKQDCTSLDHTAAVEETGPDADVILQRALVSEDLRRAIRQLTEEQQQVIILKFVGGYSNEEVARMLRKKNGAIRALQYRALRSLQQILEVEALRGDDSGEIWLGLGRTFRKVA